ncbi:hypothetical protein DXG03_008493 [Asterophora parasitica]|uniref:Uncharacterized protein n=1 Tax=Asterophora parasitica TaxID=117018 RepID=A0A9P7GI84_9AGAR|nr:hypothetical protein DXG03_008493 [Asterophora parasitica]
MLDGVADDQLQRKRKKHADRKQPSKKRKVGEPSEPQGEGSKETSQTMAVDGDTSTSTSQPEGPPERPIILRHLVIGINEVTKRLESQIRDKRRTVISTTSDSNPDRSSRPLQVVLVCRADVNPPILIDHLPHLVAAYNSLKPQISIKLVSLPAGSELSISRAVGLRRAAVLGVDVRREIYSAPLLVLNFLKSEWPGLTAFMSSLKATPTLAATWLASSVSVQKFIPTHVKQLRTSAPKDMKAEKQRRKEEKASKKAAQRAMTITAKNCNHAAYSTKFP